MYNAAFATWLVKTRVENENERQQQPSLCAADRRCVCSEARNPKGKERCVLPYLSSDLYIQALVWRYEKYIPDVFCK